MASMALAIMSLIHGDNAVAELKDRVDDRPGVVVPLIHGDNAVAELKAMTCE